MEAHLFHLITRMLSFVTTNLLAHEHDSSKSGNSEIRWIMLHSSLSRQATGHFRSYLDFHASKQRTIMKQCKIYLASNNPEHS
jgi:hypothetical protein